MLSPMLLLLFFFNMTKGEKWDSLVAQMVKNLPESRRPGFHPWLGWYSEWQPTPVLLPGESHRGPWQATVRGVTQSWILLSDLYYYYHQRGGILHGPTLSYTEGLPWTSVSLWEYGCRGGKENSIHVIDRWPRQLCLLLSVSTPFAVWL